MQYHGISTTRAPRAFKRVSSTRFVHRMRARLLAAGQPRRTRWMASWLMRHKTPMLQKKPHPRERYS